MKKTFILILLTFCLMMSGCAKSNDALIYVASDTHYLSDRSNDGCEAFQQMLEKEDSKMTDYCGDIFDAFSEEVIKAKPDILILSGDLTFNGDIESHEDFADKLKTIQNHGIQVLVIPGNHDINITTSSHYEKDKVIPADSVTAEEFAHIYENFGMKQAEARDPHSLCYLYKVNNSLYLLMIDADSVIKNTIQPESIEWIENQLKEVQSKNAQVIAVSHENLYVHNKQKQRGYNHMINQAEDLLLLFEKYGVKLNLSGHIHMQHIVDGAVTEILTSSLISYPVQYGIVEFNGDISYHTKSVDMKSYADKHKLDNPVFQDFAKYSEDYYWKKSVFEVSYRMDTLNLSSNEETKAYEAYRRLDTAFFSGKVCDIDDIQEGIDILSKAEDTLFLNFNDMLKLKDSTSWTTKQE